MPHRSSLVPAVAAAALAAVSMLPLYALPAAEAQGISHLLHAVALVVAVVLMLRSARRADAAQRRSRLLFAASLLAVAASAVLSVGHVVVLGEVPMPSLVDLVAMMWVPLAVYGLWCVPSEDTKPLPRPRHLADAAVTGTALLFTSWLLVLKPIVASDPGNGPAAAIVLGAYPVIDVVVATIVLSVVVRARADQRAFLSVIAAGLLLAAVADSGAALRFAQLGSLSFGWPDVVLQAALVTLACGAQVKGSVEGTERPVVARADKVLPFAAPTLAMAVALLHALQGVHFGSPDIVMGVLMMSAVVVRQVVFVHEISIVAEGHRRAARQDGLTGLANRMGFLDDLAHQIRTGKSGSAVAIIDLDGFKGINDSLGHECGDRVLIDFGRALSLAAGDHLVARLGGDEFALLVDADDAEGEAQRIAGAITRMPMPGAGGLALTCSVGVSAVRAGDGPADVLRRADLAMFWVKRSPYARIAVFDERMAERADRRRFLLAQLSGAAGRGELRLVYQPIFRVEDQRLVGAEALLRWRHPVLGDVPPDEFVPLAEESGGIRGIGAWVIDAALAQAAAWRRRGRLLPQVLVNVAAVQFTDALPHEVGAGLMHHGISPHCLVLEIAESQLPGLAANRAIQSLRRSGVRVAMDDFGSGYSSLAQLARLPVDILKIDRDVIANLGADTGRVVLDSVVRLARALGLETIAEGIEKPAQAQAVREAEIDYQQGFLFACPLEADDLFALLAQPLLVQPRSSGYDETSRRVVAGELG